MNIVRAEEEATQRCHTEKKKKHSRGYIYACIGSHHTKCERESARQYAE